ncbi:hypothetical protein J421_5943 (plasmid) [Gemmatirosa kalamazoonensis]|uniref:Uncharacterized protein n=1 Tax=Gemmatirosa kalamazoonensis TaxID=861299 RepID=W0RV62_9BACT|nr:hypothetical protein J421_5943 [Gemmatirosa kalamazoonensis]
MRALGRPEQRAGPATLACGTPHDQRRSSVVVAPTFDSASSWNTPPALQSFAWIFVEAGRRDEPPARDVEDVVHAVVRRGPPVEQQRAAILPREIGERPPVERDAADLANAMHAAIGDVQPDALSGRHRERVVASRGIRDDGVTRGAPRERRVGHRDVRELRAHVEPLGVRMSVRDRRLREADGSEQVGVESHGFMTTQPGAPLSRAGTPGTRRTPSNRRGLSSLIEPQVRGAGRVPWGSSGDEEDLEIFSIALGSPEYSPATSPHRCARRPSASSAVHSHSQGSAPRPPRLRVRQPYASS